MRILENLMWKTTACKISCWHTGRGCPCSCNYIPFPPSAQIPGAGCWPGSAWLVQIPRDDGAAVPDRVRSSWVGWEVRCAVPTDPCWVRNHPQAGPWTTSLGWTRPLKRATLPKFQFFGNLDGFLYTVVAKTNHTGFTREALPGILGCVCMVKSDAVEKCTKWVPQL